MPYSITLRSRTDAMITGWYDGSSSRWSTDHTRQKLFHNKRTEETAVAMLLNHVLTGCRGKLAIDVHARRAVHQCVAIGDRRVHVVEQTHIAAVPSMHMGCVDHSDPSVATNFKSFDKLRHHSARSRRFHRSASGHKIILHIDHNHRCLG